MTHTTIFRDMGAGVASGPTSDHAFTAASALLFATSAAVTIAGCASMSAMPGMPMPGGWTMSMAWMRMPGQMWPEAAASFLGMWIVMMVAMMQPSVAAMLRRYRQALRGADEPGEAWLTTLVGVGYFFVWTVAGIAAYPVGVALAAVEMHQSVMARLVPFAAGVVVIIAGAIQFTPLKAHYLVCCREASGHRRAPAADSGAAWRQGVHFGLHCSLCCANLTVVLLVLGVMDLRAMVAVTVAITAERLAPAGERVARAIGFIVVAAGLLLILRAAAMPGSAGI